MSTINSVGNGLSGATGTGNFVGANTPTLITPNLGVATATSINFGGSTLSVYTSPTIWTPVFTFATPGNLSVAYTVQQGYYSRVGNIVIANFYLSFTPTYTTSSGVVQITGLPVAANGSVAIQFGNITLSTNTFPAGVTHIYCLVVFGSSLLSIQGCGSATPAASFGAAQFITATAYVIQGTITYQV